MSGSISEHLESYISKVHKGIAQEYAKIDDEKNVSKLLTLLVKELQGSREQLDFLQMNLQTSLTSENHNLTTLYVKLKDENKQNIEKMAKLENEIDILTLRHTLEIDTLNKNYEEKLQEKENYFNTKIKQLESDHNIEEEKHKQIEQELRDQLEIIQMTSDLKRDEVESQLKQQLVDTNTKLRQTQNMLRDLQLQQTTRNMQFQRPESAPTPSILQFGTTSNQSRDNQYNISNVVNNPTNRAAVPLNGDLNLNTEFNKNDLRRHAPTPNLGNHQRTNRQFNASFYELEEYELSTTLNRTNNVNETARNIGNDTSDSSANQDNVTNHVHNQQNYYSNKVQQKLREIRSELKYPPLYSNSIENDTSNSSTYQDKSSYNQSSYYSNKVQPNTREMRFDSKYPPLHNSTRYANSPTVYKTTGNPKRTPAPPLKPCSMSVNDPNSKNFNRVGKRRKLFDPENLHYLEDYEPTQSK